MKNYNFVKKYNRQINIFLALYCVLCLIFLLLFYGFFITPKAYNDNTSVEIHLNFSGQNQEGVSISGQATKTLDTGNGRSIFLFDNNLNFGTPPYQTFLDGFAFLSTETFNITTNSANYNPDWIGPYIDENGTANNYLYNYLISFSGYNSNWNSTYFYNTTVLTYGDGSKTTINRGPSVVGEIEYVTSVEDAIKYLNGDDSVAQVGNPLDTILPEDDSLPVPQSLTCELNNNNGSYPRFIGGSWSNPNNLLASYDASDVEIEIQYKPKLQFYKKVFDLKLSIAQSDKWLDVCKMPISQVENWVSYLNLSENNQSTSDKVFRKNGKSDIEYIATANNIVNFSSHVESLNGTSWRCRYIVGGNTSLWVVYGVDSLNRFGRPINKGDNITFENASGDSVSASDVDYNNSDMTEPTEQNTFLGRLKYNLDGLSESLNSFFTPSDNGNGFYKFFSNVFREFPEFWILFTLGLVIAILLRILGR